MKGSQQKRSSIDEGGGPLVFSGSALVLKELRDSLQLLQNSYLIGKFSIFKILKRSCQCCMFHITSCKIVTIYIGMASAWAQKIMNSIDYNQLTLVWLDSTKHALISIINFLNPSQQVHSRMPKWIYRLLSGQCQSKESIVSVGKHETIAFSPVVREC